MGINRDNRTRQSTSLIDRIRKSQASLKGKRSKIFKDDVDIEIYRPKAGKHIIDVIPYAAGDNDVVSSQGEETYTFAYESHRIGANNGVEVICPGMFDKPCPVCEMVSSMDWDTEEDLIRQYKSRKRNLYNVIVHTSKEEKAKGIQVFDAANFYFESQIVEIAVVAARDGEEETIIDFAHPKKGKSIRWTIKSGNPFDEWKGHAFLDRNYKIDKDILRQAYCLDELIVIKSYNEIKKILDGVLEEENNSTSKEEEENINFSEIIRKLEDVEDMEELIDLVDDYDLDEHDFEGIDEDNPFEEEKAKLNAYLGNDTKSFSTNIFDKEEVLAELKEVKDFKALRKFIKLYDEIDFSIDKENKFLKEKSKLRKYIKGLEINKPEIINSDDLVDMSFEELIEIAQTDQFADRLDIEDYTEEDIEELVDDLKDIIDDIPF